MGLYAQHGYGKSDKIDKGIVDKSIEGIVLSPTGETPIKMVNYIDNIKDINIDIIFDPQFYLLAFPGNVNIGKMKNYDFYISETINKTFLSVPQNIERVVQSYIDYQNSLYLKKIVSPSIFFDNFDSRLSQISISLANTSISYNGGKNLFISLCINEDAFKNMEDVRDFLDIITLYDVQGFYIILERNNNNSNFINSDTLANIMYFLYNLSVINMFEVIVGYSGYIGPILYATGIKAIATGWYEKNRKFNRNNYYQKTGMRKPNKRYYSNRLLNALLLIPEIDMIYNQGKLGKILSQTKYDYKMYNDFSGEQWSDSISCLERWEATSQLLTDMDKLLGVIDKVNYIKGKIENAIEIYKDLPEDYFDSKSKSTHLEMWLEGLDIFLDMIK